MRKFYSEYPDVQTVSGHLTWSFICELLIIDDKTKRSFYEKETVNSNWSYREMKRQIEDFLLELGRGFMFVGSQQRITINNTHYYVDMVFYNKILRSYILIELNTTKLNIADGGQLNTYLNYYKTEINDENDNPPIGIILCTEKDDITAEYILGGFENNLFASKYVTILPDKQKLIQEVENIINR